MKWFDGWGFMRFWEDDKRFLPGHGQHEESEQTVAGSIKPNTWRFPIRDTLSALSTIPRRAEYL